jgi:hypothetical protein
MKTQRNLKKEIIESVINALKTEIDKKHSSLKVTFDEDDNKYYTEYKISGYKVQITLFYKKETHWFSKDKELYDLKIFFDCTSYGKNKNYRYEYNSEFYELKKEIYEIMSEKYSDDLFKRLEREDLEILESLDGSIDQKYKRESTIDDILEDA